MLNENQRRLRRSKQSERDLGHLLLEVNGPDSGVLGRLASTTGRLGHLPDLKIDVVSSTYAAENKQVKVPARMLAWWLQIGQIAREHGKEPLLRVEPTNAPKLPIMHIITESRHRELLEIERDSKTNS